MISSRWLLVAGGDEGYQLSAICLENVAWMIRIGLACQCLTSQVEDNSCMQANISGIRILLDAALLLDCISGPDWCIAGGYIEHDSSQLPRQSPFEAMSTDVLVCCICQQSACKIGGTCFGTLCDLSICYSQYPVISPSSVGKDEWSSTVVSRCLLSYPFAPCCQSPECGRMLHCQQDLMRRCLARISSTTWTCAAWYGQRWPCSQRGVIVVCQTPLILRSTQGLPWT